MNYQYNQQPQAPQTPPPQQTPPPPQQAPQQMPQVPVYVNAEELKKRKKEGFEKFAGKLADFCRSNSILAVVSGFSDILSYIVTGVCVVMSIVLMCLGSIYAPLSIAAIIIGVLAISKKTALPLATALSGVALVKLVNLIFTIVYMASASSLAWLSSEAAGLAAAYVFQMIFILLELGVLTLPVIMAWQYFAATLPPKQYPVPMYNNQMPQQPAQNYQQPAQSYQQPPVQNYQQPPVQNYQQPPVQNYQQPPMQNYQQPPVQNYQQVPPPVQPQAPAGKQCPNCGKPNAPEAAFCHGCGTKLQ